MLLPLLSALAATAVVVSVGVVAPLSLLSLPPPMALASIMTRITMITQNHHFLYTGFFGLPCCGG